MPTKNNPPKPPAQQPKRTNVKEKQYEIVQMWRKREFPYASQDDTTADERATAMYKPLIDHLYLKIQEGYNMDSTPRYKVHLMNFADAMHPSGLIRRRDGSVESRYGIAISSFRIPHKQEEVVKALKAHTLCWQPDATEEWKNDQGGKAFYVRDLREDARGALEVAVATTDKAPKLEDKFELAPEEGEIVFAGSEEVEDLVEELV